MSTARLLDDALELVATSPIRAEAARGREMPVQVPLDQLRAVTDRLNTYKANFAGPLTIALMGEVKAGKSGMCQDE